MFLPDAILLNRPPHGNPCSDDPLPGTKAAMPPDSTHSFMLCLALTAIVTAWWLFCRPAIHQSERVLSAVLFSFAQIIGISIVLALCDSLAFGPIVGLNLAAVLAVLTASLKRPRRPQEPPRTLRGEIVVFNIAASLLCAGYVGLVLFKGWFFGPASPDDRWYHIPMAFLLRQEHGFKEVGHAIIDGYPKNFELWLHWLMELSGGERWLDVGQLPFIGLYLSAVYCLARRLQASAGAAYAASITAVFAPLLLAQLLVSHNDFALNTLLIAALAALVNWYERPTGMRAAAFGCALGLMLGMKGSALSWTAVLLPVFVAVAGKHRRFLPAAAALLLTAALGAYPYILNALRHANPFYPYALHLGALSLPGPLDPRELWPLQETAGLSPLMRLARSWLAPGQSGYGPPLGGLGVLWLAMLPAFLASLVIAIHRRDGRRVYLYVLAAVLFVATPLNFSVRFSLFIFPVGAIALFHLIEQIRDGRLLRTTAGALVLGGICITAGQGLSGYRYQIKRSGQGHAATCLQAGDPLEYRQGFAWLQEHLQPHDEVVSMVQQDLVYSIYCLWNAAVSSRVSFAEPRSPCGARTEGRTYYLIPSTKLEESSCTPSYNDPALAIAAASPPLSSPRPPTAEPAPPFHGPTY